MITLTLNFNRYTVIDNPIEAWGLLERSLGTIKYPALWDCNVLEGFERTRGSISQILFFSILLLRVGLRLTDLSLIAWDESRRTSKCAIYEGIVSGHSEPFLRSLGHMTMELLKFYIWKNSCKNVWDENQQTKGCAISRPKFSRTECPLNLVRSH